MGGWQTKQSPSPGHLHHIEMWCAEHSCYIDLEGMNFDSLTHVVLFCKVSRMVAQRATLSRWRKLTEWTFLHPNSLDRPAGVGALGIRTNEFSYQLSQFHNFNGTSDRKNQNEIRSTWTPTLNQLFSAKIYFVLKRNERIACLVV